MRRCVLVVLFFASLGQLLAAPAVASPSRPLSFEALYRAWYAKLHEAMPKARDAAERLKLLGGANDHLFAQLRASKQVRQVVVLKNGTVYFVGYDDSAIDFAAGMAGYTTKLLFVSAKTRLQLEHWTRGHKTYLSGLIGKAIALESPKRGSVGLFLKAQTGKRLKLGRSKGMLRILSKTGFASRVGVMFHDLPELHVQAVALGSDAKAMERHYRANRLPAPPKLRRR